VLHGQIHLKLLGFTISPIRGVRQRCKRYTRRQQLQRLHCVFVNCFTSPVTSGACFVFLLLALDGHVRSVASFISMSLHRQVLWSIPLPWRLTRARSPENRRRVRKKIQNGYWRARRAASTA
jgi:hypothetical protein